MEEEERERKLEEERQRLEREEQEKKRLEEEEKRRREEEERKKREDDERKKREEDEKKRREEEEYRKSLPPPAPDAKDFEGIMDKRGGGTSTLGRKSWKRRYMSLNSSVISWFVNKGDPKPKNKLQFGPGDSVESSVDETDHKFCFCLKTKKRTLTMSATSEEDRVKWMKALQSHIDLGIWKSKYEK